MLDIAPPPGQVQPPSVVDAVTMGPGRAFVDAIVVGDFDRLQTLFAPAVRFRAIIPDEYQEASTAAGARALIEDWFGGTDRRVLIGSSAELVGDRLALGYRLELMEEGERRIVEQHVAAVVDGASFRELALVCTGFRPLGTDPDGAFRAPGAGTSEDGIQAEAPAFTPAARLDASGLSCATLTPAISATVRGLDFGAVLEIVTDDPEAEEGLRSWTRLTGNELVAAEAGPGSARRFHIRRSPPSAATTARKGAN
jgi:TusA-related sulfurtransferase